MNNFHRFDPHWLRFNCHSALSRQPGTGQRTINVCKVPEELFIEDVKRIDDDLIIKWNRDSNQHDSLIPLKFLLENHPLDNLNEESSHKQRYQSSKVF